MTKRICVIVIVLMILYSGAAYGLDDSALFLETSHSKIEKGETFRVFVKTNNIFEIYGLQIELAFDPDYISPEESKLDMGAGLRDKNFFIAKNTIDNKGSALLTFTLLGDESPITAKSTIASIELRARKSGTTAISIERSTLLKRDGTIIDHNLRDIAIKISSISTNNRSDRNDKSDDDQRTPVPSFPSGLSLTNLDGSPIDREDIVIHESPSVNGFSSMFTIESDGALKQSLILSIEIDRRFSEKNLGIYYYNGDREQWIYLGGIADGRYITTAINRFGKFQVMENINYKAFDDIDSSWAKDDIERLTIMGIVNGVDENNFSPKTLVSRAQISKVMALTLGLKETEAVNSFSDSQSIPDWSSGYINTLSSIGIITGYRDGSFRPYESITRLELAVMIDRALKNSEGIGEIVPFADDEVIPYWAKDSVYTVRSLGILEGYQDGTFRPNNSVTREELCRIMVKLLKLLDVL